MKFSNFFIPTLKEVPSDIKLKSHNLMIRSGMIRQETSGIYSWLPLGYRVLSKIIKVIEEVHIKNGINQILMPTIQSADIWKESNRYETYGKEMLRISDRNDKELLYGPTNEEMITKIGKQYIKSYKNLPRKLFHIQSKFRDEIRPRFGVMRAREFLMKDAYSFDVDEKNGEKTYLEFFMLYLKIFKKLNIPVVPVRAPSGEIGGNLSHEFHLLVESGESEIFVDNNIFELNFTNLNLKEILSLESYTDDYYHTNKIDRSLKKYKSIELGHIFLFGTKYSSSFDFTIDYKNEKINPYMGSYGIGVSRIPAAFIEYSNDQNGLVWSKSIAPFAMHLINLLIDDEETKKFCDNFYKELINKGFDVIYDDRSERPGKKFSDADLIGTPIQIICGNLYKDEKKISVLKRTDKNEMKVNSSELISALNKLINEL
tara:strand:- start:282 stop:1568 length:1287 start_codon:yes stop_codon:yes gene_type:complete